MKLLYVKASGFKNIQNDCVLDFTAKSKKTTEYRISAIEKIEERSFTGSVFSDKRDGVIYE